ncbi:MAG: putative glycoside hydrolase [Patescibacteria group bacterium]
MKAKNRTTTRFNRWLALAGIITVAVFVATTASLFTGSGRWRPFDNLLPAAVIKPTSLPISTFVVTHLPTPESVRAIYLTSWVAGTMARRAELVKLIDETELNAVVIDIKDYTGRITFTPDDPILIKSGAVENRIPDIKKFIGDLHARGIYVIGRISVFQDVFLTGARPELAVLRLSDGAVWRDRKGIAWLEPGATEVWDYIIRLARASYAVGFDELNFDYIRFPSDGDMKNISYRFFDSTKETRVLILKKFFAYLHQELGALGAPLSIDLFGLTTTAFDDLGIGQMLVEAAPYFDYLAPMVYPSHFASGFLNFTNPADHPYEVVKHSLTTAGARLTAASSTASKLRPWLQDFDLGADYTAALVRAQIQATAEAGLTSWMLWSPSNRYTREALEKISP